jgi:hypothetical protein
MKRFWRVLRFYALVFVSFIPFGVVYAWLDMKAFDGHAPAWLFSCVCGPGIVMAVIASYLFNQEHFGGHDGQEDT